MFLKVGLLCDYTISKHIHFHQSYRTPHNNACRNLLYLSLLAIMNIYMTLYDHMSQNILSIYIVLFSDTSKSSSSNSSSYIELSLEILNAIPTS